MASRCDFPLISYHTNHHRSLTCCFSHIRNYSSPPLNPTQRNTAESTTYASSFRFVHPCILVVLSFAYILLTHSTHKLITHSYEKNYFNLTSPLSLRPYRLSLFYCDRTTYNPAITTSFQSANHTAIWYVYT